MKAIRVLKYLGDYFAMTDQSKVMAIQEAISELEALQQPKSCDGCVHRSELHEELTNGVTNGFCVENGFFTRRGFCCNQFQPKDSV